MDVHLFPFSAVFFLSRLFFFLSQLFFFLSQLFFFLSLLFFSFLSFKLASFFSCLIASSPQPAWAPVTWLGQLPLTLDFLTALLHQDSGSRSEHTPGRYPKHSSHLLVPVDLPKKFMVSRIPLIADHHLLPDSAACRWKAESYLTQPSPW